MIIPDWSIQGECPRFKDVSAGVPHKMTRQPDGTYKDPAFNGFMASLKDINSGKLTLVAGKNPFNYGRSVFAIHGINKDGNDKDTFFIQYVLKDYTACETKIDVPSINLSNSKEVEIIYESTWEDVNHK